MTMWRIPRTLYMRLAGIGKPSELGLYRWWSQVYDLSVALDPAYCRELYRMIDAVVRTGDDVLDVGCGTGLATLRAARTAKRVVGIDASSSMLDKLNRKIERTSVSNVELTLGRFPEVVASAGDFDSFISSFTVVHVPRDLRALFYQHAIEALVPGGRIGLFAARGEVLSIFETRAELAQNLRAAGFCWVEIHDVSDVYRYVTAERP